MRIRASWRDPYSGVPLMFTSSSPGCSRRDSAALPPSSTWVTERGVKGGTAQRISQGMFHGHRVSGEALEKVPEPQAPQRDLRGQALPLLWSHEFLSKGIGRGEKEKCPIPADSPAGTGSTRALCPMWMPAPCRCFQPHIEPVWALVVILMPKGCHPTPCAHRRQQQGKC